MATTIYTIATDLGVEPPSDKPLVSEQWELWISDAEALIEARRIEVGFPGPIDPVRLDYAVRKSIVSHIKKPDDATQITVSVDDGSTSRRYESGKGMIDVSGWWDYLGLAGTGAGAWTIRPAGNTIVEDPAW